MKAGGQRGGKTEGKTEARGRGGIDKACWKFLTLAEAAGEESTAIGQEMKLDKFNAAASRLLLLRCNRWGPVYAAIHPEYRIAFNELCIMMFNFVQLACCCLYYGVVAVVPLLLFDRMKDRGGLGVEISLFHFPFTLRRMQFLDSSLSNIRIFRYFNARSDLQLPFNSLRFELHCNFVTNRP